MAGCSSPNCCIPPTRQADQQARLLWANQGLMAQNSSNVLLKTCSQALLQPALSAQAKDLQLGPALGAIHWRNAAHGAVLQDGSSREACHQDSGGISGVLRSQFSAGQGEADLSRGGRQSPLCWRALLLPWWQLHLAAAQVAVEPAQIVRAMARNRSASGWLPSSCIRIQTASSDRIVSRTWCLGQQVFS